MNAYNSLCVIRQLFPLLCALSLFFAAVAAADDSCDCVLPQATDATQLKTEWTIELSYATYHTLMPIAGYRYTQEFAVDIPEPGSSISYDGFAVQGKLRIGNFFIEVADRGLYGPMSQSKLGYYVSDDGGRQTSLLYGSTHPYYRPGLASGFESLEAREGDEVIGIRRSYLGDDYQLDVELFKDNRVDAGFKGAARYERYGQLGRLGLEGSIGLTFLSSDYNNHYFGVSEAESTDLIPAYTAGSALEANAGFRAMWPVKRNVFFAVSGDFLRLADSTATSPLVVGRNAHRIRAGIHWIYQ